MNKDVIKAIRKCGTPMTNSKFWSKAALTEAAKKAKEKGIEIYYNSRDHRFSSSGLRKQVKEIEENK